jgi:hypothetical protein
MRRKVSAVSAKESAQPAHASQEAIRMLIPPSLPCPCSLVPSVTTPLYSTAVCQALRQTLRSRGSRVNFRERSECELRRIPKRRSSQKSSYAKFAARLLTPRSPAPIRAGDGERMPMSGIMDWCTRTQEITQAERWGEGLRASGRGRAREKPGSLWRGRFKGRPA